MPKFKKKKILLKTYSTGSSVEFLLETVKCGDNDIEKLKKIINIKKFLFVFSYISIFYEFKSNIAKPNKSFQVKSFPIFDLKAAK